MSGIELKEYVGYEAELKASQEVELDDEALALQEAQAKEEEPQQQ